MKEIVESVEPGIQKRRYQRSDGTLTPWKYRARCRDQYGRQVSETFIRLGEARKWLRAMLADKDRGDCVDPARRRQPYGPWAREWLRGLRKPDAARKQNLSSIMEIHILPTFDRIPFAAFDETLLRKWANDVAEGKTSERGKPGGWHLHAIRGLFLRSLRAATIPGLVTLRVLMLAQDVIDFPAPDRKPERFLNHAEAEYFIAGSTNGVEHIDPRWRPFHYAAVWTGCCWEELAGLLRANLDLDAGWLHVSTVAAKNGRGGYVLKDYPKNDYRRRSIELPAQLIETLRFHLAGSSASRFVFPNRDGELTNYDNFRSRVFAPAVESCDLDHFTFHDLRHTHCSWLIDLKLSEYRIVRRMGWKDGRMLHSTYGHRLKRRDREGMEGLEQAWTEARAALV